MSVQRLCKQVCVCRPKVARPCVGIHKRTSLMSSSLLPQQCFACRVCLTWMISQIRGRWPYSWCFEKVLLPGFAQDSSYYYCDVLIKLFRHLFCWRPSSASIWKQPQLARNAILLDNLDFYIINNLSVLF